MICTGGGLLRADLSERGRIAIVEFDEPDGWLGRKFGHFTPKQTIVDEMKSAGYRSSASHDFLPTQIFEVFAPESGGD